MVSPAATGLFHRAIMESNPITLQLKTVCVFLQMCALYLVSTRVPVVGWLVGWLAKQLYYRNAKCKASRTALQTSLDAQ
jgi:carboxylesterase type B